QRQTLERSIVAQARDMIKTRGMERDPALVLASEEWHGGVIGIVAGRLAEQYARPALVIAIRRERDEHDPRKEEVVGIGSSPLGAGLPLDQALRPGPGLLLSA